MSHEKRDCPPLFKRAAELTHTMYELEYTLPSSHERKRTMLRMDEEQQTLYGIIYDK